MDFNVGKVIYHVLCFGAELPRTHKKLVNFVALVFKLKVLFPQLLFLKLKLVHDDLSLLLL